jgi:hypothetical protein
MKKRTSPRAEALTKYHRWNAPERRIEMAGVVVFKTLADALRAGYHVYDRTEQGYLVRTRTAAGWAMALVSCR